jgi:YVTN family beta-propeller protein
MATDARVGSDLAGYRIESVLGRGGMSTVYLAENARLKRKVALKIIKPELAEDARFRDRFVRESQLAASLDHPNIVPIYEAGEEDGVLYIAMRYVRGTDLRDLIERDGHLDPSRTARICAQVASALDAAHSEGLVHRDVKPGNVLVVPPAESRGGEHVYLSDFGLTKRAASDSGITKTGQFMGTVDYVAPEQIEGKGVDGRTDQYSLACVAYECLTGEPPYRRDTEVATIYAHLKDDPPSVRATRPEVPPEADAALRRGMAKRPEDRFPTCGDLAEGLQVAIPTEVPSRTASQRSRLIFVLAGVALVLGLTVGALLLTRDRQESTVRPSPSASSTTETSIVQVPPNSLIRIDPATNQVEATIPAGGDPMGAVLSGDSVWVVNLGERTITRVGLDGGEPSTIGGFVEPWGIAAAPDGGVWVTDRERGNILHVNRLSNRVDQSVPVGAHPNAVAVTEDALWATLESGQWEAVEVSQPDRTIVGRVPVGAAAANVTTDLGYVWVSSYSAGTVQKISPDTDQIVDEADIDAPGGIAVAGEAVWVADWGSNTVVRLNAFNLSVEAVIAVPSKPWGIAADGEMVWVTTWSDASIVRIDPASNQVVTEISLNSQPGCVVIAGGKVWVTIPGSGTFSLDASC